MAYDLRARKLKNYKEVANIEFCKVGTRKRSREEKLYELEVIEKDRQNRRVKVHYVGYESEYDEWRDEKDVNILLSHAIYPSLCRYGLVTKKIVSACIDHIIACAAVPRPWTGCCHEI